MSTVTPADFEKEIKSAVLKNIYYIYGKDSGRVSSLSELVRRKYLGKNYTASDYSRIDGKCNPAVFYPLIFRNNTKGIPYDW